MLVVPTECSSKPLGLANCWDHWPNCLLMVIQADSCIFLYIPHMQMIKKRVQPGLHCLRFDAMQLIRSAH